MNTAPSHEVISGLFLSSPENLALAEEITLSNERRIESKDDESIRQSRGVFVSLEISDRGTLEQAKKSILKQPVPDMWSRDYIGLYCQYAAVGKAI